MTRKVDCWNEIVSRLRDDPTLSGYVEKVFEGFRDNVLDNETPCIIIFPKSGGEVVELEMQNREREAFLFGIRCLLNIKDKPDYVVGSTRQKGILDFEEDVKNAVEGVSGDRGLNQTAYDVMIKALDYKNHADSMAEVELEVMVYGKFFTGGQR
jgi:hypothetical protein